MCYLGWHLIQVLLKLRFRIGSGLVFLGCLGDLFATVVDNGTWL